MGSEKKQKYFINRQEHLTIRCRACGKETTFPVDKLRDKRHSFKVNCTCAASFDIEFSNVRLGACMYNYRVWLALHGRFSAFYP